MGSGSACGVQMDMIDGENAGARRHLNRRRMIGIALGAAVALGIGQARPGRAQDVSVEAISVTSTAAVNLRSGPGTTYNILAVVPAGTGLPSSLEINNRFQKVTYNGLAGWISIDFLTPVGSDPATGRPDGATQFTGQAKVMEAVNFRAGASTSALIDLTMAAGTVIETSAVVRNGFRAVRLNGLTGWVIDGALVMVSGGDTPPPADGQAGYTNTDVNFRMGPNYGNNVIRVLPVNTIITIRAETSGEFVHVTTPGDIGWVFAAYVTAGTPPGTGNPPPVGGTAGTVTSALNLRAQPSTASQILAVMPGGASITITGPASNGFLPVTYNGLSGWAAMEYLRGGVDFRTTTDVNLRELPSMSASVLTIVPAGAGLSYAGTGKAPPTGWSGPFDYGNLRGFVATAYVVAI